MEDLLSEIMKLSTVDNKKKKHDKEHDKKHDKEKKNEKNKKDKSKSLSMQLKYLSFALQF